IRVWLERPLDGDPGGRRVRPVQVRGAAVEGLAAVFLLERPFRQADVGLLRDPPLLQREHRAPLLTKPSWLCLAPRPAACRARASCAYGPSPSESSPCRLYPSISNSSSSSPLASSALRFDAASIAFRNAARTPACSSSRIAAMVVPPGDVTISRNS